MSEYSNDQSQVKSSDDQNPIISDELANAVAEEVEQTDDPTKQLIDPDLPITKETLRDIGNMVKDITNYVKVMQSTWEDTVKEFSLKDEHMKELYAWNMNHRDPEPDVPEDSEEKPEYDRYNGFDKLTDDEIIRIFGEDHPIIGVDTQQTIDRIKSAFAEFIECLGAMRELKQVHDAYAMMNDMFLDQNMRELQEACDRETDPEKKAMMQESLDTYYSNQNLGFMKSTLEPDDIKRIVRGFTTKRTCEYWMKRSINKLKQMKISSKFLEEIWGFEKRYLDEKYHRLNNMVLAYFMQLIVYCQCGDTSKENVRRVYVLFMFSALDAFIQNRMSPERKDLIKEKICEFLDVMMEYIPEGSTTINDLFNPE